MISFNIKLKTIKGHEEIIYIPLLLLKKLELKSNQSIPIHFGLNRSQIVTVRSIKNSINEVYITSKLRDSLLIPYSKNILIKKESDGIRIGPIIGILTTDYTGVKFSNLKTGMEHPFSLFFKNMLSPEPSYPTYYFIFTPDNVDWQNKTVNGFFFSNDNRWSTKTVPLPDVVYNRIPNRTLERLDYIDNFKNEYILLGGKLFNNNFFNKWDIYNILIDDEKTRVFIPETHLSPSIALFKGMLERHPIIYLKPANGSLGLGIYKIIKKNSEFIVQFRNKNTNKAIVFKDSVSIYKYIFTNKFRHKYIIQQGINLVEYIQSPVDFRVHMHKNSQNKWQVIAIGAKVAGKGSVTTHLRTGGQLINADKYLNIMFKEHSSKIIEKIKASSIQIAESIESKLKESIGELGLDIGVDKDSRIWLFEVNSKPGRSIFKHPSLKTAQTESNKRLIEYAMLLSDFKISNIKQEGIR